MKKIIFIRNSDIRFDTRLRKAMYEATECGFGALFYGWIRDESKVPLNNQDINGKIIETKYFNLSANFGSGLKNIIKLLRFNLWVLINLIKDRKSYDAIYVCDLDVALPALCVKVIFRKKIIYDIFDFYSHTHSLPKFLKLIVERLEYKICKIADIVIVCTSKRALTLEKETNVKPVIIFNTPNLEHKLFSKSEISTKKNNAFTIVYVGTLSVTGRLLKEITEIIKKQPDINFKVAGNGPLEKYFQEVSLKYKNIIFYGQVSNDEALELQNSADLLFATYDPSFEINKNSAPNKVYEAMALHKPIIVCKDTDADTTVVVNNCGISIGYDQNQFMTAVNLYRNNHELKILHGENGFKFYKENCSWMICKKRLHLIFASLV